VLPGPELLSSGVDGPSDSSAGRSGGVTVVLRVVDEKVEAPREKSRAARRYVSR
jgi:hypothetical protein